MRYMAVSRADSSLSTKSQFLRPRVMGLMLRSTMWFPPRCYQHRGFLPCLCHSIPPRSSGTARPTSQGRSSCLLQATTGRAAGLCECALGCVHGLVLLQQLPEHGEYGHGLLLPLGAYLVMGGLSLPEVLALASDQRSSGPRACRARRCSRAPCVPLATSP